LSFVVLVSAALVLQSFRRLTSVNPGFDPRNKLTFAVTLPPSRFSDISKTRAVHAQIETQLLGLPGVRSVAAADALPLTGNDGCSAIHLPDRPVESKDAMPCMPMSLVTAGYFHTLGIGVRGRAPDWSDANANRMVAVISRSAAIHLWPGQDPLGKTFGPPGWRPGDPMFTVIAEANDVRSQGLDKSPPELIYFPILPQLANGGGGAWDFSYVLDVGDTKPALMMPAVRRVVASVAGLVPISRVRTLDDIVAKSTARASFATVLLALASVLALMLCAVGIYGITSFLVVQRRSEIGIRMALGAQQLQVGRLVMLQTVRYAGLGVMIGLLASLALTRALTSQLFQVSPTDPIALLLAALFLLAVVLLATLAPALRAMRVDPVKLLHE